MKSIASRQNPVVARYRSVATRRDNGTEGLLLLDGPHLVEEALAAGLIIRHALIALDALERPAVTSIASRLEANGVDVASATASVMAAVSPVTSPSGIVALLERPDDGLSRVFDGPQPLVVIACDIQDPGNLGAIVRVAEAAGASGLLAAGSSADPFGWKALRGSMGSALRLPIARIAEVAEATSEAKARGCRLAATVPREGRPLFECNLTPPLAILVGGEGAGLPASIVRAADERITIPMHAPVESLNAAVTAAIVLYQVRRNAPAS